jgi:hypothetical protein
MVLEAEDIPETAFSFFKAVEFFRYKNPLRRNAKIFDPTKSSSTKREDLRQ